MLLGSNRPPLPLFLLNSYRIHAFNHRIFLVELLERINLKHINLLIHRHHFIIICLLFGGIALGLAHIKVNGWTFKIQVIIVQIPNMLLTRNIRNCFLNFVIYFFHCLFVMELVTFFVHQVLKHTWHYRISLLKFERLLTWPMLNELDWLLRDQIESAPFNLFLLSNS